MSRGRQLLAVCCVLALVAGPAGGVAVGVAGADPGRLTGDEVVVGTSPAVDASVPVVQGPAVDTPARTGRETGADTAGGELADTGEIHVTYAFERLPDSPGAVSVQATADLPDEVVRFEMDTPDDATVTDTNGFDEGGERGEYAWDEDTTRPSITYRIAVNRTSPFEGYHAVDVGDWAVIDNSDAATSFYYWYRGGTSPDTSRIYTVADGEQGYATGGTTYLGGHDVREASHDGTTVRLVVSDETTMRSNASTAAETLGIAAASFDTGASDGTLTVFVVPDELHAGYALDQGRPEFVVRGSVPVTGPPPVWLHEFVHTRQAWSSTDSLSWLDEGSAEYYGTLLSMQQGHTSYDSFRALLTDDAYADADLTAPESWESPAAEYGKGARVVAALDYRIRQATGGDETFEAVFRRLNDREEPVSYEEFKAVVSDVAGQQLGAYVDNIVIGSGDTSVPADPFRYTTGPAADNDGDGLTTADERSAGTHPFLADTDGDGLDDGREAELGTDPTAADTDGDGLPDSTETDGPTDPTAADTDDDGLPDDVEVDGETDPTVEDTDGDGLDDGREAELSTEPTAADTDVDGLDDGREQDIGTDPTTADTDGDGLDDGREVELGTDPTAADTDGDGRDDGGEVDAGSDPLSAATATDSSTDAGASGGSGDDDGGSDGDSGGGGDNDTVSDSDGDSFSGGDCDGDGACDSDGDCESDGDCDTGGPARAGDDGDAGSGADQSGDANEDATGGSGPTGLPAALAALLIAGVCWRLGRRAG